MNPSSNSGSLHAQHQFLADQPIFYKIRIEGILDPKWATWFDGFSLTVEANDTVLSGWIADSPALYGLLTTISDLGLTLVSVERLPVPTDTGKGSA